MEKLTFPQPIPDLSTGYLIKLTHKKLEIDEDFELTQTVKIEFYTDVEGDYGIPAAESIDLNPNLSFEQKERAKRAVEPTTRTTGTRGFYVDPSTQAIVQVQEDGTYPDGAIPERLLWLNVLAQDVPGDKLSDKVKALLLQSMGKMISRGRI